MSNCTITYHRGKESGIEIERMKEIHLKSKMIYYHERYKSSDSLWVLVAFSELNGQDYIETGYNLK